FAFGVWLAGEIGRGGFAELLLHESFGHGIFRSLRWVDYTGGNGKTGRRRKVPRLFLSGTPFDVVTFGMSPK
ncbi:MAG: hypothetical protein ACM3W7_07115, partial [Acidobacteriota bacterium]